MNFTREPIIETVITPKEGSKLVVRNSKGIGQEDYFVDAIEVVSFGSALFYRSTERPKSFLVPVSDYEVLELKETRLVLKNVGLEKSIKIGGGKEPQKNFPEEHESSKKKDKRRPKRKMGMHEMPHEMQERRPEPVVEKKGEEKVEEQQVVSSTMVRRLIPPPTQLIKEKLAHIIDEQMADKDLSKKQEVRQPEKEHHEKKESLKSEEHLDENEPEFL